MNGFTIQRHNNKKKNMQCHGKNMRFQEKKSGSAAVSVWDEHDRATNNGKKRKVKTPSHGSTSSCRGTTGSTAQKILDLGKNPWLEKPSLFFPFRWLYVHNMFQRSSIFVAIFYISHMVPNCRNVVGFGRPASEKRTRMTSIHLHKLDTGTEAPINVPV